MSRIALVALVSTLFLITPASAQDHMHGGASEKLGTVRFASTCSAPAQKEFNRAVALLHSFEFSRAIDGFQRTLQADPSCSIAYWGIALSQWGNPFADGLRAASQLRYGQSAAAQATALAAKSDRERAYIAAVTKLYAGFEHTPQLTRLLHYRDAMAEVARRYPQDLEASIFYALALAASADPSDKTYRNRLEAGRMLEKLFTQEPDHPGLAHYMIHTYDVPPLAHKAIPAARRYAQIAPDAPHALHMPSHTFTRVGYWEDSIASNVAAAASARRVGETAEELHADDYLAYAYLQSGRDQAAENLVKTLPQLNARFDPSRIVGGAAPPAAGYYALAAIPARFALERNDWQAAARLPVHDTPVPFADAVTWFARGLGLAHLGDAAGAQSAADALGKMAQRLQVAKESYWAEQVDIQRLGVLAWAALAQGRKDDALRDMRSAAQREDATEKSAITPGPLKPARELLGEMLLQLNQPKQALVEFENTLKREPNRFRALYGAARAAHSAGDTASSQKYFRRLLAICANGDKPGRKELAKLVQIPE
jgi:tetratricopeptide (TPR) repeat protein